MESLETLLDFLPDTVISADGLCSIRPVPPERDHRRLADITDLDFGNVIGAGGMGTVRAARQCSLDRSVAVKTVVDEKLSAHLVAEALVLGALEHPNIVPVYALAQDEKGQPALVMKRVEGVAWSDLLADADHPEWKRAHGNRLEWNLNILVQVCNAIHFAHSKRIIHRDIKPSNVMIGAFGEVYVLDWGLALDLNQRGRGEPAGTPAFMAPEMLDADQARLDQRTDVFLLGATLHFLLTSEPRNGRGPTGVVLKRAWAAESTAFDDSVPAELRAIVNRACAKDRSDRPPTAEAFKNDIMTFLQHRSAHVVADQAHERLAELEALLEDRVDTVDHVRVYRTFGECKFGLQQALAIFPEEHHATGDLDRATTHMVRYEVARKDHEAAERLLAEMKEVPDSLARRVQQVRIASEQEAREVERLRELEHERDPAVGRRARIYALLGIISAFVLIASILVRIVPFIDEPTTIIVSRLLALFVIVVGGLVARKWIFTTSANRNLAFTVLVAVLAIAAAGVVGVLLGLEQNELLGIDLVLLATASAVAGTMHDRRFLVLAVWLLSGAIACAFYALTDLSRALFAATVLGAILIISMIWYAATPSPHRSPPDHPPGE